MAGCYNDIFVGCVEVIRYTICERDFKEICITVGVVDGLCVGVPCVEVPCVGDPCVEVPGVGDPCVGVPGRVGVLGVGPLRPAACAQEATVTAWSRLDTHERKHITGVMIENP